MFHRVPHTLHSNNNHHNKVPIIRPNTIYRSSTINRLLLYTTNCFGCPDQPSSGRSRIHRKTCTDICLMTTDLDRLSCIMKCYLVGYVAPYWEIQNWTMSPHKKKIHHSTLWVISSACLMRITAPTHCGQTVPIIMASSMS